MNILVIEDEEPIRRLLKLRLELKGYSVSVAKDGPEALAMLAAAGTPTPGLVLCDVHMPGMDGYEVCRKVRALGLRAPFLFLTSRGRSEDKVRGIESGANDYIVKPFDPLELEAKIAAHVGPPPDAPSAPPRD